MEAYQIRVVKGVWLLDIGNIAALRSLGEALGNLAR